MRKICKNCKYDISNNGTGKGCITYRQSLRVYNKKCRNASEFKPVDRIFLKLKRMEKKRDRLVEKNNIRFKKLKKKEDRANLVEVVRMLINRVNELTERVDQLGKEKRKYKMQTTTNTIGNKNGIEFPTCCLTCSSWNREVACQLPDDGMHHREHAFLTNKPCSECKEIEITDKTCKHFNHQRLKRIE